VTNLRRAGLSSALSACDSAHTASRKLLSIRDVLQRVPVSRARLYQLVKAGAFPRQVRIGGRAFWLEHELEAYIAALADKRNAA
jgi:prophage regulatory protein